MRLVLFWGSVSTILYTYILYPVLVMLRGKLRNNPVRAANITPRVSMIISAYNEAENIEEKLKNTVAVDYPKELLEVIVASDGSSDGTNEIVRRFEKDGIRLLDLPRQGKARCMNTAVSSSSGEILVFSDANSMYNPGAIRALVAPFADSDVGGVAGNQVYKQDHAAGTGDGEKSYWKLDRKLKSSQSQAGNAISATGAIYAIRKSLFMLVPEGVTDDFVTSTRVIAQGYRLVFAPDAKAFEPVAKSSTKEFGRKVRVINRGLRSVWVMRELMNPFKHGFYALQIFSHKILRRLAVFPLIILLIVSPLLWSAGLIYKIATVGQAAFYTLALLGSYLDMAQKQTKKIFSIPFFFGLVNLASFVATINILRGKRIVRWEPQRQGS